MQRFLFWAISYLALLLASIGLAAWQPLAFQKANVSYPATGGIPALATETPFDVGEMIGRIPYRGGLVWKVRPSEKFEATILGGSGTCASKTLGLAYHLGQSAIDFQIIDLLHPRSFLAGAGHTLLRVGYQHDGQERVGLVDLLEGGLPHGDGRYLDVADLENGAVPDARIEPLNVRKDDHARYFGDFLEGVVIAFRSADEVTRYHNFLESIYVPLGNEKLEKYTYDGLSLFLGILPSLYITDYQKMMAVNSTEIYLHRLALWTLRSSLVVLPFLMLLGWRRWHRSRSASPNRTIVAVA